jgi:hypothetical protein
MTNQNEIKLQAIKDLVEDCIKNGKIDFLANIVLILQKNYQELALLSTNGAYHEGWCHQQVIDHVTYET